MVAIIQSESSILNFEFFLLGYQEGDKVNILYRVLFLYLFFIFINFIFKMHFF